MRPLIFRKILIECVRMIMDPRLSIRIRIGEMEYIVTDALALVIKKLVEHARLFEDRQARGEVTIHFSAEKKAADVAVNVRL